MDSFVLVLCSHLLCVYLCIGYMGSSAHVCNLPHVLQYCPHIWVLTHLVLSLYLSIGYIEPRWKVSFLFSALILYCACIYVLYT